MELESIRAYDAREHLAFNGRRIKEKAFRSLSGLLRGICVDGVVNQEEQTELWEWIRKNAHYAKYHPWDLVINHLEDYLRDGKIDPEEIEDLVWLADRLSEWTDIDDLIKDRIQELHGIFHGILADRQLSDEEINSLRDWVFEHDYLAGSYPYDEISSLLVNALTDGNVTHEEREQIMTFMGEFIDFNESATLSKERFLELKQKYSIKGICAVDPEVELEGKTFCVTGEFEKASREEVCRRILDAGGLVKMTISKKIDYLVVGNAGNRSWAFSCYGRKVEQAVKLRKEGAKLVIVCERDFWDALGCSLV